MPRPAKFTDQGILDAAAVIAAEQGPAAATMTAIGAAIGAPNASLYHRFKSRDELLGRLWLQKAASFQNRFAEALKLEDAREAGLEAALSMARSVRADPLGARVLLLHRREDFMSGGWPSDMSEEAQRLRSQVATAMKSITRRLLGSAAAEQRELVNFALIDVPFATVRRYVGAGQVPPPQVDDWIRTVYETLIGPGRKAAARRTRKSRERAS